MTVLVLTEPTDVTTDLVVLALQKRHVKVHRIDTGDFPHPTTQRPLRLAEFDDLFAVAVRGQQRLSPTRLRWWLDPAAESAARDLTAREAECCSFFSFTFAPLDGAVQLDVEVPAAHVGVLDALAQRSAVGIGS
jgi:hypothetical protein